MFVVLGKSVMLREWGGRVDLRCCESTLPLYPPHTVPGVLAYTTSWQLDALVERRIEANIILSSFSMSQQSQTNNVQHICTESATRTSDHKVDTRLWPRELRIPQSVCYLATYLLCRRRCRS